MNDTADYSAMGVLTGDTLGTQIPVFRRLKGIKENWAKALGAAMAASGAIPLFHIENVTPELLLWKESKDIWLEGNPEDIIEVDQKQLEETYSSLTTSSIDHPDLAFMGCPHCSLSEIIQLTQLMEGKKLKKDVRFWLCTSRHVKIQAETKGLLSKLEASGIEIYCDTCIVVTWLKDAGINSVATNSGKAAYYAPSFCNVDVVFDRIKSIVEKVTE
jgi:predicted aconitase